MAPVGSQVVLKAGICGADGYLHADRRIEWLLARDGVGQFVDVGERGEVDVFRWLWDTPRKVDNWYAIGATAYAPYCVHRGTPDPSDDVQVVRGEAWITVSSPVEGTSHVTAYAPAVGNWQFRQANATIHWIDAQWSFPPSATVTSGRPHVLTTTVTRRSNGAPLAGWVVRYDVSGGGASLGYAGGNFVDATTDAAGRASVEVSPSDVGGGTATIGITIIQPATAVGTPQLEVGRGSASITWGSGTSSAPSPVPATGPPPLQPTPAPTLPAEPSRPPQATSPTTPYESPRGASQAGPPQLEVRLTNVGPQEVAVGGLVSFDLSVTNRGESTARNIVIQDHFDPGLRHEGDEKNVHSIEYTAMPDLRPGQTESLSLTFQAIAAGRQCHEVTVTADGVAAAPQSGCVNVRQASLSLNVTGHLSRFVGESAEFRIVVRNNGDVPAHNVVVVQSFPPQMQAVPAPDQTPVEGGLQMRIDSLRAGEQRVFTTQARCVTRSDRACSRVVVTADGGATAGEESCLMILPPMQ
jgi:uncharacterized repeat protein (TIGR01451 family)